MILVDTSIWIDHLRRGDRQLATLLEAGEVVCHPFVKAAADLAAAEERWLAVSEELGEV